MRNTQNKLSKNKASKTDKVVEKKYINVYTSKYKRLHTFFTIIQKGEDDYEDEKIGSISNCSNNDF